MNNKLRIILYYILAAEYYLMHTVRVALNLAALVAFVGCYMVYTRIPNHIPPHAFVIYCVPIGILYLLGLDSFMDFRMGSPNPIEKLGDFTFIICIPLTFFVALAAIIYSGMYIFHFITGIPLPLPLH